jgi:glycosyltransferase involved in cell wall biosynthesis
MFRVALVCEPPDGGVAEHVAQLALNLPGHGYEATVLCPPRFGPRERLVAAGIELRTIALRRTYRHPQSDARALVQLVSELRRGRYDIVHTHAAKGGVLGRIAALPARTPAVYSPHCFPFVGEVSVARRVVGLAVEGALARATSALVCVCKDERDRAVAHRLTPYGQLAVIYNGCPPCPDVAPQPALAKLREKGPVVGAVSVLRRQKRLDVLIDAAPRVIAAVPDAQIAIVGSGPEEHMLRARAAREGARVTFVPFEPPSARALRALDVYVLPSGWEAFPIGVVEAQACGVPQVVTDVGGTREAVTPDTGLVVPPRDPHALASALIDLLRDPARRATMVAASRVRHADRFTLDRMVSETAAVYARAVQEGVRTRRGRRSPREASGAGS